ncbi:MAG: hypothetical protein QOE28_2159 [Solirubrobacteraceae bacterium]|nr:hypothetical protein [Solirubrobacteraceae bacterium]
MTVGTMLVPYVALDLPAEAASIGEARRRVSAFAAEHGGELDVLGRIRIAISEAVTNAVVHGNAGARRGVISVMADFEEGDLEVVVTDDGRGLGARVMPGAGLGLGLVEASADRLRVRDRAPHGVEVWMRFALVPRVL